jgi:hypothetical protein
MLLLQHNIDLKQVVVQITTRSNPVKTAHIYYENITSKDDDNVTLVISNKILHTKFVNMFIIPTTPFGTKIIWYLCINWLPGVTPFFSLLLHLIGHICQPNVIKKLKP